MGYTPENNPYIPGDPYSYDLAWMVQEVKKAQAIVPPAEAARDIAIEKADIATEKADVASAEADQSEAWAVGRKNNIPVSADEPQYENHSKYWADQSFESATNAQISEENAAASELAAKNYADNIADPVSGIVTSWLTDHISNPSNPPLDTSLSVGSAAADSAAVGEALMNKLTIGGSADYTLWSQIAIFSDSGLPPTRRWFINKIFRIGTYIDTIDFDFSKYSIGTRSTTFEIWSKSGNSLTKVKTVSVDITQLSMDASVGSATATIDYLGTTDFMIAILTNTNEKNIYYTIDPDGNDNVLVSMDVDLSTSSLSYSSLSIFSIKVIPSMQMNYSVTIRNIKVIGFGGDYEQIQDALNDITDDAENNPYTLLLLPSNTPYEPFSMLRSAWTDPYPWSGIDPRWISIIGMNKEYCVIKSESGSYSKPCGEPLTNGIIKNITFIMNNDDQDAAATQGGYCLHIDSRTNGDVGYDLVIEDCDFYDASGPCLGIGTHENCHLTIRRCNLKTTLDQNYNPHAGYTNLYNYGVIFCHTSTLATAQDQVIHIEDCIGSCADGVRSLWIASAGAYDPLTAEFTYRIIRNVFWNESEAAAAYDISSNLTKDPMCFGNNDQ